MEKNLEPMFPIPLPRESGPVVSMPFSRARGARRLGREKSLVFERTVGIFEIISKPVTGLFSPSLFSLLKKTEQNEVSVSVFV